ncbi:hypothetical protein [Zavarzinia sp. CC-PAN008]|uniref:hypothetical protein n=1 Tax=Zavarzinia sp. CC-PAN008 TaxID=3243332 RepID=UPI003F7461C5
MPGRTRSWLHAAPVLTVLAASPVLAQAPAPALTTETIRTEVQKYLDVLDAADMGSDKVDLVGKLEVTQEDSTFKVRLPEIVVTTSGMPTTFPPATITFRRIGPEQVDFNVDLPNPITVGTKDAPMLSIAVGKQSFSGIWNPAVETWPKLDMLMSDIVISSPMMPTPVKIREAFTRCDIKEVPTDDWGGNCDAGIRGLDFKEPESGMSVAIGNLYWDLAIEHYRLRKFYELAAAAGMTVTHPDYLKSLTGEIEPDPAKMLPMARALPDLLGGMSYKFGVEDVKVSLAPVGPPVFEVKSGSALIRIAGGENQTEMTTSVAFDGLALRETGDEFPPELIPDRFKATVTLDRVPAAALWTAAMDMAQGLIPGQAVVPGTAVPLPDAVPAPEVPVAVPEPAPVPRGEMPEGEVVEKPSDDIDSGNPKEADGALTQSEVAAALDELPQPIADLVRQARPRVKVDAFEIAAAGAALSGTGEITLNPQTEKAGPGQFSLRMDDMGGLMSRLSAMIENEDDAKGLLALALIRGFGDPAGSDGKSQVINFTVDEAGLVKANGVDLSKLIELMD